MRDAYKVDAYKVKEYFPIAFVFLFVISCAAGPEVAPVSERPLPKKEMCAILAEDWTDAGSFIELAENIWQGDINNDGEEDVFFASSGGTGHYTGLKVVRKRDWEKFSEECENPRYDDSCDSKRVAADLYRREYDFGGSYYRFVPRRYEKK